MKFSGEKQPLQSNTAFWVLVIGLWFAAQIFSGQLSFIVAPFHYLSTWVHELGHGIGAVMGGGRFDNMLITKHFGGLAYSQYGSDFSYWLSIVMGLIAPSLAGFLVITFARRFDRSRIVLWILTAALILTGLFFSRDMFTRLVTLGLAVPIGATAFWGHIYVRSLLAQIIGITFCLSAVAGFDYFFFDAGAGGSSALADTQILAKYFWGNQLFWALFVSAISLMILYLSGRVALLPNAEPTMIERDPSTP